MPLDDHGIVKLQEVIRNSFRVRKNQEPLYVDLGNNLERDRRPSTSSDIWTAWLREIVLDGALSPFS